MRPSTTTGAAIRNNHRQFVARWTQSHISHQNHLMSLLETKCDGLTQVKQIHAQIAVLGFHQNSFVLTKLIRTLTRLNSPMQGYPSSVFRCVNYPSAFLYTAIIRGHSLAGDMQQSIEYYSCMRRSHVRPTSFTYCALLHGCTNNSLGLGLGLRLGLGFHGVLVKVGGVGMELFLHAWNKLIDFYVKFGVLECARKVFDEMPVRDVFSRTSLITAYARVGEMDRARELFDELGFKDGVIWNAMVTGYVQNARPREGLELFEMMWRCQVEVDEFTLASVISACAQLGTMKYLTFVRDISDLLGDLPERSVVIGSALVDMYSKCGRVDDAFRVFGVMKERNVYTFSSMILGFAAHGRANEAMQLFYDMERWGIRPNHVTLVGVLTACSHAGMVEEGRRLFWSMKESYGVEPSADHFTCIVDLLGRSGHLEEALSIANSLPAHPHGGVWGALLGACNIYNNPDIAEIAAEHLFELEPDSIGNYMLLYNILASARRWDDASRVQQLMKNRGLEMYHARSWV